MKYKAVIFDLDGTLYDNRKMRRLMVLYNWFHLNMLASERFSRHRMSGRYYGTKGATFSELFRRIAAFSGSSEDWAAKWYWQKFMPSQVKALRKHCHAKPWVLPLLGELKEKGVKLACYSEYSFVREKLKALGIEPLIFDYISDAPSAGGCKPCRKALLHVAEKLQTAPEDILMVGDREDTDGAGADSANMDFLLVPKCDMPTPSITI